MKTLFVAGLAACAQSQDETSLMQGLAQRIDSKLSVTDMGTREGRKDATERLMETATKMMKNGVTPDVVTFIDATLAEINNTVLPAILDEHQIDQDEIDRLLEDLQKTVDDLELAAASIADKHNDRTIASDAHKQCRSSEALDCARSRRCEEQLEHAWVVVKREEYIMREIHFRIESEWCLHPPSPTHPDLSSPFNFPDEKYKEGPETSQNEFPYPVLSLSSDVQDFRTVSVTEFSLYINQKPIVKAAWDAYNSKIIECAQLETHLETQVELCDEAQDEVRTLACEHASANREARQSFGSDYHSQLHAYELHASHTREEEYDRKREWETLHIVTCLLDTVYDHVSDPTVPCITEESHPEQTEAEIQSCHVVYESLTAHLTIDYGTPPEVPPLPPVVEHACSAEYVWDEQGFFTSAIRATHNQALAADEGLANYFTVLSVHGWAGCAAPKVCIPCEGLDVELPSPEYTEPAAACKPHEEYLRPGESNLDSFRCTGVTIGGTPFCVPMSARCNNVENCGDGSDEWGCDTPWNKPAILQQSSTEECRRDATVVPGSSDTVQFFCNSGQCTSIEGRCNGFNNCGADDDSDEQGCSPSSVQVTVEASTGFQISVQRSLSVSDLVFHDRAYSVNSVGSFTGVTFIKMSNDDKHIDHSHVQMKVRLGKPSTLYVVKLTNHELPWLASGGWELTALEGVSYSGVRSTRHTDWSGTINEDHFGPGVVYAKTFTAGTVSMPGNSGGDGSYLLFLADPSSPPLPPAAGLVTLHWGSGTLTMTDENENVCLPPRVSVGDQAGYPNDELTSISGLRQGCQVDVYQHGCGTRRGTTTTLTADGAIGHTAASGVFVTCPLPASPTTTPTPLSCPFDGCWTSTVTFGRIEGKGTFVGYDFDVAGDSATLLMDPNPLYPFAAEPGCSCTLQMASQPAHGQLSPDGQSINWEPDLNNDVWIRCADDNMLD